MGGGHSGESLVLPASAGMIPPSAHPWVNGSVLPASAGMIHYGRTI